MVTHRVGLSTLVHNSTNTIIRGKPVRLKIEQFSTKAVGGPHRGGHMMRNSHKTSAEFLREPLSGRRGKVNMESTSLHRMLIMLMASHHRCRSGQFSYPSLHCLRRRILDVKQHLPCTDAQLYSVEYYNHLTNDRSIIVNKATSNSNL